MSWHLTGGVGDFVLEGFWSHHHLLKCPLSYLRGPAGEAKLTQVPFSQNYKTAFIQDALALLSWYTDLTLRCRKTRCFLWTGEAMGKQMGSLRLHCTSPACSTLSRITAARLTSNCKEAHLLLHCPCSACPTHSRMRLLKVYVHTHYPRT